MNTIRHLLTLALLVVVFLSPQPSLGQGKAANHLSEQEKYAHQLYLQGRYKEACDIYVLTTSSHHDILRDRVVVGLAAFLLIDVIGALFFLYVEKRKAYRLLVEKTTECARRPVVNTAAITFNDADEVQGHERLLLDGLQQKLEVDKVYLDSDLTIESLAAALGTSRAILSKLVNQHLGRTFPTLINQYRINEAVRLLSHHKTRQYTIEAIAQMCGYNNRQVFHQAFKKETGITPMAFRDVAESAD